MHVVPYFAITVALERKGEIAATALELAYVAAGRIDAMICRNINVWDIAAGILLVREAGGFTGDPDSEASPMDSGNIIAANAELMAQYKAALKQARNAGHPCPIAAQKSPHKRG